MLLVLDNSITRFILKTVNKSHSKFNIGPFDLRLTHQKRHQKLQLLRKLAAGTLTAGKRKYDHFTKTFSELVLVACKKKTYPCFVMYPWFSEILHFLAASYFEPMLVICWSLAWKQAQTRTLPNSFNRKRIIFSTRTSPKRFLGLWYYITAVLNRLPHSIIG